jgi:hypothetical protein
MKYTNFLQAGRQLWYTINCISLYWTQYTNEIEQQKSADDLRAPPRKLVSGLCLCLMSRSGQVSEKANGVPVSQQVAAMQQAVNLPAVDTTSLRSLLKVSFLPDLGSYGGEYKC